MIKYRVFNVRATAVLRKLTDVPRDVRVYSNGIFKTFELWWKGNRVLELGKRYPFSDGIKKKVRKHFVNLRNKTYEEARREDGHEEKEIEERMEKLKHNVHVEAGKEAYRMMKKLRGLVGPASVVIERKD